MASANWMLNPLYDLEWECNDGNLTVTAPGQFAFIFNVGRNPNEDGWQLICDRIVSAIWVLFQHDIAEIMVTRARAQE